MTFARLCLFSGTHFQWLINHFPLTTSRVNTWSYRPQFTRIWNTIFRFAPIRWHEGCHERKRVDIFLYDNNHLNAVCHLVATLALHLVLHGVQQRRWDVYVCRSWNVNNLGVKNYSIIGLKTPSKTKMYNAL